MDAKVAILLAVKDGACFLDEQLKSLELQTVRRLDIWASDDGSGDASLRILEKWRSRWMRGAFRILSGPRAGFVENFRSLILNSEIDADYFAFCDQDDLWDSDKLESALAWLAVQEPGRPALYCSRTRLVSENGVGKGLSPLFDKPPSFANALVQSLAGGNTIVLNRAARDAVREASRHASFVSHDWWCYLVVTGVGGLVHYSPIPKVRYRQHENNLVGQNASWGAQLLRFRFLLIGGYSAWNDVNLAALDRCFDMLTPRARATLKLFEKARSGGVRIGARRKAGHLPQRGLEQHQNRCFRAGEVGKPAQCLRPQLRVQRRRIDQVYQFENGCLEHCDAPAKPISSTKYRLKDGSCPDLHRGPRDNLGFCPFCHLQA